MKKLFLSMAFVGLGTFAMAQQTESSTNNMKRGDMKQNMEMKQQKHLDKMKTELNLTDAQVLKIKALQQKMSDERKAKMADRKAAKMNKRGDVKNEMKQILTPEQYTKWETKMHDKMAKMKGKRMNRKNGGMNNNPMKMETK
ncbi:hypothetical protein [Halpernia sp.]|uniref:hypothetical protein n=1 Tax=Halpernia sp. TaxID=2782209 RepID=UPI003A8FB9F6